MIKIIGLTVNKRSQKLTQFTVVKTAENTKKWQTRRRMDQGRH